MENNNSTSFIIIVGIIILCVFVAVVAFNVLPNNIKSVSYYAKVKDEAESKIETLYYDKGNLIINTSGNPKEYCVKTTKTEPDSNNICWKQIINNNAITKAYGYKKYYVWIKDSNGNISKPESINTK